MAKRPDADAALRRREAQDTAPVPVSRSSYLNEKDRYYRAAETLDNGADLARRGIENLLDLDRQRREVPADAASPQVLAAIEQFELIYVRGAGNVVSDFINRPYERW
jgi:hypothetical protein